MKFDCIIMNPPYEKNLHLKILAEAITHLKNDNSKCVNLSPINKFRDAVRNKTRFPVKVTQIDVISAEFAGKVFDIGLWSDIGIYCIDKDASDDYSTFNYIVEHLAFIRKMQEFSNRLKDHSVKKAAKFSVRFFAGCGCDASHSFRITPKSYEKACQTTNVGHIVYISVETPNEQLNLHTTYSSQFIRFCCKCTYDIIPWMGDSINPRTGLKGYESEWTDEDFCQFFNITPDEQKIIEDTMAKYK